MTTRQSERQIHEAKRLEKHNHKVSLLRKKSTCTCCSAPLNFAAASVVADYLFCPKCVGQVRQRPKPEQLQIIARMQQPKPHDANRDSREFVADLLEKFTAEHSLPEDVDMSEVSRLFPWEHHEQL